MSDEFDFLTWGEFGTPKDIFPAYNASISLGLKKTPPYVHMI